MSPARTPRPHRRPGPPADPPTDPPSGPAPAAAVAPAGSLDSFCPLIDLASIISDIRRDKAARHAEKPYPARNVQDLPGCYFSSSGVGTPENGISLTKSRTYSSAGAPISSGPVPTRTI